MKTRTVVERIGENMGPIEWDYEFRQHFDNMGTSNDRKDEACTEHIKMLRTIVDGLSAGKRVRASTSGGWPRIWQDVLDVGMYDGWPYWKPTPSVLMRSPLGGGEWHAFSFLTGVQVVEDA